MAAQRRGDLGGPFVGEEQLPTVDLDDGGGAGDGVPQPVGPLGAEEDVAGAPDDEGRDLQAGQIGLDRQQVARVQRGQQPLELAGGFPGAERLFRPAPRDLIGQVGDVLVAGGGETLLGPGEGIRQQPPEPVCPGNRCPAASVLVA